MLTRGRLCCLLHVLLLPSFYQVNAGKFSENFTERFYFLTPLLPFRPPCVLPVMYGFFRPKCVCLFSPTHLNLFCTINCYFEFLFLNCLFLNWLFLECSSLILISIDWHDWKLTFFLELIWNWMIDWLIRIPETNSLETIEVRLPREPHIGV